MVWYSQSDSRLCAVEGKVGRTTSEGSFSWFELVPDTPNIDPTAGPSVDA